MARSTTGSPSALAAAGLPADLQYQYMAGYPSFSESYFTSFGGSGSPSPSQVDSFGSYEARLSRYSAYWAHYEGNVYRRVNRMAADYLAAFGLYEYTRTILSPAYRLGEFWATHLMGGPLDATAGDDDDRATALPIHVPDSNRKAEELRAAIAVLWHDSNWGIHKEQFCRFGATLGDAFLFVEDDESNQRVKLRVVHPRIVRDVTLDGYGNVKSYVIQEMRRDPRDVAAILPRAVLYTEVCQKVGEAVEFSTYIDTTYTPFDWRDYPDGTPDSRRVGHTWTEPYGFVPLVKVQHRDMGLGWGWPEIHPSLSRMHEIDDLASKLDDQIRMIVANPRYFTGTAPPGTTKAGGTPADNALVQPWADEDAADDQAARGDVPIFYNPSPDADVKSLLGTLDIAATSEHIFKILALVERTHPELAADMASLSGDASGRALRVAREKAEALVVARRQSYDDALVRAHKMAVSIGAMKGYPDYAAFTESSYAAGELDHAIGDRPVFAVDRADRLEEATAFGNALVLLTKALPLGAALRQLGVDDRDVDAILAERDAEARAADRLAQRRQVVRFGGTADMGGGETLDSTSAATSTLRDARAATHNGGEPAGGAVPIGEDGRFGSGG